MANTKMNKKGDTKKNFKKDRKGQLNAKGSALLPKVPTKAKIMQFVRACNDSKLVTVFALGCFMGLRIGSAIRLLWTDVDLKIGKMSINNDKNTKRFKSDYGKDRVLDIPSFYIPVLKQWQEMNPNEEYVIPREDSKANFKSMVRHYEYVYDELYEKLGMKEKWMPMKNGGWRYKYNAHSGRHICATNMLLKGVRLEYIQEFLGHANIEETRRYLQIVNRVKKQDIEDAYYNRNNQQKVVNQIIIQTKTPEEAVQYVTALSQNQKVVVTENGIMS